MTGQRRLAAILAADVVGFSRLAGGDEQGTLARLNELRRSVIDPQVGQHGGRLFKAMGDGFLVEFASPVQALACARAIQDANASGALSLRIGLHLGDVVVEGDDLMGDGVNIAVRLEGIADPGGISLSRQIHDQVHGKVPVDFEDRGEIELKNLVRPVHVFRVAGARTAAAGPALALPDKPSIAVLPFENMSGDPEQDYFADGMVEDIITALSRFKSLFVIARNSSFTYKGKAVDIKRVGRELGVRYVLEGSVRKAGSRVRITGQLFDSETGGHLWADRFDGALEDVFDLQDEVTGKVIAAIAPSVERAEIERALRKPTASLGAHDCYLRASALLWRVSRDSTDEAMRLLGRALEVDPGHSSAMGLLLAVYASRRGSGYVSDAGREVAEVERLVRQVVHLGQDDAVALGHAAFAIAYVLRDLAFAEEQIRRALMLNSNLASAWAFSGYVHLWSGNPAETLKDLSHATRLDPLNQLANPRVALAHAYFFLDRHEDALRVAETMLQRNPDGHPSLRLGSASAAFAGKMDVARKLASRLERVDPAFRVSRLDDYLGPYRPAAFREKYRQGLLMAGLPE